MRHSISHTSCTSLDLVSSSWEDFYHVRIFLGISPCFPFRSRLSVLHFRLLPPNHITSPYPLHPSCVHARNRAHRYNSVDFLTLNAAFVTTQVCCQHNRLHVHSLPLSPLLTSHVELISLLHLRTKTAPYNLVRGIQ